MAMVTTPRAKSESNILAGFEGHRDR